MSYLTQQAAQRKRERNNWEILNAITPQNPPLSQKMTPTQEDRQSPFHHPSSNKMKRTKSMVSPHMRLFDPSHSDGYPEVFPTPEIGWQPPTPRPNFSPIKRYTPPQAHISDPKPPTTTQSSSSNSGDSIKTTNSTNLRNLRTLKTKLNKLRLAEKQRALVATLVRHGLLYYTGRKSNKQLRIAAVWMQNAHNYLDPATNTHPLDIMIERIKKNDMNITLNVSPKQLNTIQVDDILKAQITDAWANRMAREVRRSTFNPAKSIKST